ncbi:MAG TPA: VWA domain-containing protein [Kofleriaceae bacterium]|nr:VWA domain-containing protein [Kofleriaceae bacterium]
MKWTTLLLLSASGMAASAALVWTAVDSGGGARASEPAAQRSEPRPERPHRPHPADDRSQFRAGGTLEMEGRLGHAVLPAASDSDTYLYVDVNAATTARAAVQAPLNLAIVMDRSGSMKGKRLANALAAARSAVQRLRDGDVVSVVTYNTAADVTVSPTVMSSATRGHLLDRLARTRAAGDTCISCGVEAGMRMLGQRSNMVSRILLLSDGEATAGVRDVDGFRRVAEDCRRMGASITTIGVDVDYNERIMAALARDSNGRHFFVENPTGLPAIFDQEMESLARTVANRAELTVDLSPGVSAEQVYDRASVTSGSQLVVPLGAFADRDHKTLLVRLRVPRGAAGARPVAAVRLRYDDLTRGAAGASEGTLIARQSDDASEVGPLDGLVSARVSSSETVSALEEANELIREGRADDARRLVRDRGGVIADTRRAAKHSAPAQRAADLDAAFDKQEKALAEAGGDFAQPPPAATTAPAGNTGGAGAATAAEPARPAPADDEVGRGERAKKVRIRSNQKDAFDLGE